MNSKRISHCVLALAILSICLSAATLSAQDKQQGINLSKTSAWAAAEMDWPHWRGPEMNGISREKGIDGTFGKFKVDSIKGDTPHVHWLDAKVEKFNELKIAAIGGVVHDLRDGQRRDVNHINGLRKLTPNSPIDADAGPHPRVFTDDDWLVKGQTFRSCVAIFKLRVRAV